MDTRIIRLLDYIPENEYVTAESLASKTGMGVKTIRIKITQLNNILFKEGEAITSRRRHGYSLLVENRNLYDEFFRRYRNTANIIPTNTKEREKYILKALLESCGYIKIDDIATKIYISRAAITVAIKEIECLIAKYNLEISRKPHYGIKIEGNERRRRLLIADYFQCNNIVSINIRDAVVEKSEIRKIVKSIICRNSYVLSDIGFEQLIQQLYVSVIRIKSGFNIESDDVIDLINITDTAYKIANEIAENFFRVYNVILIDEEIKLVAIQLQALQSAGDRGSYIMMPSTTETVQALINMMLENVYKGLDIDLTSNYELRLALSQNIIPFDIRMRIEMPLKNPYMDEIKKYYMMAYIIAVQACACLKYYYNRAVPRDEIGYIALIFALALEKQDIKIHKKNVLVVCASGYGSSQLIAYRLNHELADYIDDIQIRSLNSLSQQDIDDADCIFSTVPIEGNVKKPIFNIPQFLTDNEMPFVKNALTSSEYKGTQGYYYKRLFFANVAGKNKGAVISEICKLIGAAFPIPDEFEQSVKEREQLAPTDYGNMVAYLHPMLKITDNTFISVAVLEKPIVWERNLVQVVFTVSLSKNHKENLKEFYASIIRLITDEDAIRNLIAYPSYETLMHILQ